MNQVLQTLLHLSYKLKKKKLYKDNKTNIHRQLKKKKKKKKREKLLN